MKETKGVALIIVLLILGALLRLNIGYVQGGPTYVDKPITQDAIWNYTGSPYILIKEIAVWPAAVLTIEPGVIVEFADSASLEIFGGLRAQGNVSYPITFTSNSSTPTAGIWDRIVFAGVKEFSMGYAVIEYATTGLELDNGASISDSIISNCKVGIEGKLTTANRISVTNNAGDGLSLEGSPVKVFVGNSNISSNGGHGILVSGSSILNLNSSTVSKNTMDGVILSNGTITYSLISGNHGNGTYILGNTTITETAISDNDGDGIRTESGPVSLTECNVTGNQNNGISCNHTDQPIVFQKCQLSYNVGDGIWTNSSVEIDGTDITFNGGNGVTAADEGNMIVSSSDVSASDILNNTLNGLTGRGSVSYSNVAGNRLCGILGSFTVQYSNITWNSGSGFNGTGVITNSSIFSNTPYDAVADTWPNNITATNNWWGTNDSQIIREHIYDWYNDSNLGYVFYYPWWPELRPRYDTEPPNSTDVTWNGTSPEPYDPKFTGGIRMNEPVVVSANVTDYGSPVPSGVDKVFISYRVDGGEWWRTAMTRNETSGYWVVIVPGHQGGSTVEFFIDAYDKNSNNAISPTYSYEVKKLQIGDINGDGSVDMADISIAIDHYMQELP